jgi:hypothetical protein
MATVNRGPWSLGADEPHERRGESPGSRSSPSNAARDDGGHLARSPGKGGGPASVSRKDCDNPATGENRSVVDRR